MQTIIKDNKMYVTRLSPYQLEPNSIYLITSKNVKHSVKVSKWNKNPPKEYFIKGEGWKKIKKGDKLELIPAPAAIGTYEDLQELVIKYGWYAAVDMAGFDHDSYGYRSTHHFFQWLEVEPTFLNWLNRIAEIDYKFSQYLTSLGVQISFSNTLSDIWCYSHKGTKEQQSSFRTNPFLGYHIETSFRSVIKLTPHVDPIAWETSLKCLFLELNLLPEMRDKETLERGNMVSDYFNNMSLYDFVQSWAGIEDANWLKENLTFKKTI